MNGIVFCKKCERGMDLYCGKCPDCGHKVADFYSGKSIVFNRKRKISKLKYKYYI